MSKLKPVARKSDIVVQEFGNEILIYDLRTNKAFNLNETSAKIWNLCDGDTTVSEIANHLSEKFQSPIVEDFVWLALGQLQKDELVENDIEIAGVFEGNSRRELIKRIGFASMVALPIVSSLVAPRAIDAQSSCTQTNNSCAGGNRPRGCLCSPSSLAGTPSVADGGTSNCATGLRCFSGVPAPTTPTGFGTACC